MRTNNNNTNNDNNHNNNYYESIAMRVFVARGNLWGPPY